MSDEKVINLKAAAPEPIKVAIDTLVDICQCTATDPEVRVDAAVAIIDLLYGDEE